MMKYLLLITLLLLNSMVFAQTYVSPGPGTLSMAVADAIDGDVLELVAGGEYTESVAFNFGVITDKAITIKVEGDIPEEKAKLRVITPADGTTTRMFFRVGQGGSLALHDIEFDGTTETVEKAEYLIQFYMGDGGAVTVNTIRVENCWVHDLVDAAIHAGSSDMKGNLIVDSTFVDNCVFERTGTSVYYKYCGANFLSVTNSTFNTISSYGIRVAGPNESAMPDNTPRTIIDHTTWYNIGTEDGREIILLEKGPNLNPWTVSNTICVKQINKDKVAINLKETITDDLAEIYNVCLWDVGTINWRNHPVQDTIYVDPGFADPDNGDFTLPSGSPLLSFGSDGGPIGDPRWGMNASSVTKAGKSSPITFALDQNYPNPFNPATSIAFRMETNGHANLTVFDFLGREIATLVNGNVSAGVHKVTFDASTLPSGIYLYRLKVEGQTLTRKMTLLQ
ncbi:DUF5123 domain-containing protein [candidate division KSB1 bacterium]|nr:DUF5123 domain-containing protein [candidate division KSB1 bacterium]